MSIEGVEMAAKLVGSGAKELATFLYAILRGNSQQKQQKGPVLKGRERLATMLKSGKELKVFALKEADLKAFCSEARRFGVGYYVVRGHKKKLDGLCDVMVPAEQASMAARVIEGFGYQPTDRATLQTEVERDRGVQTKNEVDRMLDEALGAPQQKEPDTSRNLAGDAAKRAAPPQVGPTPARGKNSPPAPGLEPKLSSGGASSRTTPNKKRSVKDRLDTITAAMKRKASDRAATQQPKSRKRKKAKARTA
jgi:hypothetical protein